MIKKVKKFLNGFYFECRWFKNEETVLISIQVLGEIISGISFIRIQVAKFVFSINYLEAI